MKPRARSKAKRPDLKGALANFEPSASRPKVERYDTRKEESFVGRIRLLTEKHEDWGRYEVPSPTFQVPDMFLWNRLRASNHKRHSVAFLAAWLRIIADNLNALPPINFVSALERVKADIDSLGPRPRLPEGWLAVATLALEVVANATYCWNWSIEGISLRDIEGLARRMPLDSAQPASWQGARVTCRPLWLLETKDRFTCIVPEWFWSVRSVSPPWTRYQRGNCRRSVRAVITSHVAQAIADLANNKNALEGEPEVLKAWLGAASPAYYGLSTSPGRCINAAAKEAMEAYD